MKLALAASMTIATLIASSTLAVSAPRRALAVDAYGYSAVQGPAVVTFGNRYIGQDPDANIRAQLQKDPVVSEN